MQILLFTFSFVFFAAIFYGYFNLFAQSGFLVATVAGTVMAILAWFLARVVGQSLGRTPGVAVLLAPLLLVSALGVYNSLMLVLEGGQVITDAATTSQQRFSQLGSLAQRAYAASGARKHLDRVESLKRALVSELRNPLNCGQGDVASGIIGEIQVELPDFHGESQAGRACDKVGELVAQYDETIDGLVHRAPWNHPELVDAAATVAENRLQLERIRGDASAHYGPEMLRGVLVRLQAIDAVYRDLWGRVTSAAVTHLPETANEVPDRLDIDAVESLGNAAHLPSLFIHRLDRASTWFYLAVSVGFDLLMVFLFKFARDHRVQRQSAASTVGADW